MSFHPNPAPCCLTPAVIDADPVGALNAPLNLYVDAANGNDANSGGSSGPFRTIQRAVNEAQKYTTRAGASVTINLSAGTHTLNEPVYCRFTQNAGVRIVGAGWSGTYLKRPRYVNFANPAAPAFIGAQVPGEFTANTVGLLAKSGGSAATTTAINNARNTDITSIRAELSAAALTIIDCPASVSRGFVVESGGLALDELLLRGDNVTASQSGVVAGSGTVTGGAPAQPGHFQPGARLHIHGFQQWGIGILNASTCLADDPATADTGLVVSGCGVGVLLSQGVSARLFRAGIHFCRTNAIQALTSCNIELNSAEFGSCAAGVSVTNASTASCGALRVNACNGQAVNVQSNSVATVASARFEGCGVSTQTAAGQNSYAIGVSGSSIATGASVTFTGNIRCGLALTDSTLQLSSAVVRGTVSGFAQGNSNSTLDITALNLDSSNGKDAGTPAADARIITGLLIVSGAPGTGNVYAGAVFQPVLNDPSTANGSRTRTPAVLDGAV